MTDTASRRRATTLLTCCAAALLLPATARASDTPPSTASVVTVVPAPTTPDSCALPAGPPGKLYYPTADDSATTARGVPVTIDVLANDCSAQTGVSRTFFPSTPTGDPGSDYPAKPVGSISRSITSLTFTPIADFVGTATFTYTWVETDAGNPDYASPHQSNPVDATVPTHLATVTVLVTGVRPVQATTPAPTVTPDPVTATTTTPQPSAPVSALPSVTPTPTPTPTPTLVASATASGTDLPKPTPPFTSLPPVITQTPKPSLSPVQAKSKAEVKLAFTGAANVFRDALDAAVLITVGLILVALSRRRRG